MTNDVDLVDGVSTTGFSVDYYKTSDGTTADTAAVTSSDPNVRGSALIADTTVNVSIDAVQTVAGRSVEQTASMRVTRLDTNASAIAAAIAPTIPNAPTGLITVANSTSQITVSWYPTTATSYTLEMNNSAAFNPASANVYLTASSSQVITGLVSNYTYYFRVKATNAAGTSLWSGTTTGTTRLTAPTQLAVYQAQPILATNVSWAAVTGAVNYDVQWSISSSFTSSSTANTNSTSISNLTSLTAGQPAYFRVRANNLGGIGDWSSAVQPATTMLSPNCLGAGYGLRSSGGAYRLVVQSDGNLVVYNSANSAVWNTGTFNNTTPHLCMQSDGNLVLYNASNAALWYTGTSGANYGLFIQDSDGNAWVYTSTNVVKWSWMTGKIN